MARITNVCKVSPQFAAVWFSSFLSVPGIGMVRLIVWLGLAGLGLCGIAGDEGGEVFGDGHVVGV